MVDRTPNRAPKKKTPKAAAPEPEPLDAKAGRKAGGDKGGKGGKGR